MKIKNLWPAAAGLSVGASLLATVLTSCSAANIDDDLKIKLDDEGNLVKSFNNFSLDYHEAIRQALSRADTWGEFKEALSEEIVYKWFEDRKDNNSEFEDIFKQIQHDVDKEYNDLVQSAKNKYGANYSFYLQNENLSPNGGTEASYKHIQTLKKIKDKFIEKVWEFSFFGYCKDFYKTNGQGSGDKHYPIYPRAFNKDANADLGERELADPDTWNDLGFYAYTKGSYYPEQSPTSKQEGEEEGDFDYKLMAKHPEGDYAIIQQYTFDKWFDTEKPFFSAAALFKYSKPFASGKTLKDIYSPNHSVEIKDDPSEAYPFFGGSSQAEVNNNATKIYDNWLSDLLAGEYLKSFTRGDTKYISNGTVNIPCSSETAKHTEDSQTLLLAKASKMLTEESGASLYLPYACAAAQLYLDAIVDKNNKTIDNSRMNEISPNRLKYGLPTHGADGYKKLLRDENWAVILKNFFFTEYELQEDEATHKLKPIDHTTESGPNFIEQFPCYDSEDAKIAKINSFVDLKDLYAGVKIAEDNYYHSDLFTTPAATDQAFTFFFGGKVHPKEKADTPGIRYITNAVSVNLEALPSGATQGQGETQPWILELNESGMHAQTIDGYQFIKEPSKYATDPLTTKQAAKNVLKYRLFQKKANHEGVKDMISTDIFAKGGELETYFKDNFANIILGMALDTTPDTKKDGDAVIPNLDYVNIFRPIADYKEEYSETGKITNTLFFEKEIIGEQHFGASIKDYIKQTTEYDEAKKIVDQCAAANKRIYGYRKDQITNSKNTYEFENIYANGLLAPLAYSCSDFTSNEPLRMFDYACVNQTSYFVWNETEGGVTINSAFSTPSHLVGLKPKPTFINWAMNTDPDDPSSPFSPQIKSAKKVMSNRFWYQSLIVDRFMYSFMGMSNGLPNFIKGNAYDNYVSQMGVDFINYTDWGKPSGRNAFGQAISSVYEAGKIFNDSINYANVALKDATTSYFDNIATTHSNILKQEQELYGKYYDLDLSDRLFQATLTYLMLDEDTYDQNHLFANFYKILDSKIAENEQAIVGYISKELTDLVGGRGTGFDKRVEPSDLTSTTGETRYDWKSDADNIYDQVGYASGSINSGEVANQTTVSDQYWNIVKKVFSISPNARTFSGFTGLLTASSNSLPDCLKNPAFIKIDSHTDGSLNLSKSPNESYKEHTGAWYAFVGSKEASGLDIDFADFEKEGEPDLTPACFSKQVDEEKGIDFDASVCRRLVKKIRNYSSQDDLRSLAKKLADTYNGTCLFTQIANKTITFPTINDMKYAMADALPHYEYSEQDKKWHFVDDEDQKREKLIPCFQRLTNVELHDSSGPDGPDSQIRTYHFDDANSSYRLMLTQIAKADVTEKTLAPKWENNAWVQGSSPITPEEFFYILCQTANDSSTQSIAITRIVKKAFGSEKMIVYDANIYNAFNSVWIKDWVKKPMGS